MAEVHVCNIINDIRDVAPPAEYGKLQAYKLIHCLAFAKSKIFWPPMNKGNGEKLAIAWRARKVMSESKFNMGRCCQIDVFSVKTKAKM